MKTAANPEDAVQRFLSGIGKIQSKIDELRELSIRARERAVKLRENGFLEQAVSNENYCSLFEAKADAYLNTIEILKNEQLL